MTDYISRDALLSATEGYDWQAGLKTVLKRIPAADVRPAVRGKWEYNGPDENVPYCSNCMLPSDEETRFCAGCGADMRGEI